MARYPYPWRGLRLLLPAASAGMASIGCSSPGAQVRSHLSDWQDLHLQNYVFVHAGGSGYGPSEYDIIDGWHRVEVHAGVPQPIATAFTSGLPARAEHPFTIDALMERFARALDRYSDPDELHLEYDSKYHFVTKGWVDGDVGTADDGFSLYITCFSTSLGACPPAMLTAEDCAAKQGIPTPVRVDKPRDTCPDTYNGATGQIMGDPSLICCID